MTDLPHSIQARVEHITKHHVRLKTRDNQTIEWPASKIAKLQKGDPVTLIALSHHDIEQERELIAKQVLAQILNPDQEAPSV